MKIINFIICDDIRNEIGNKYSLMGVYDDLIEFHVPPDKKNSWPKMIRLGIFAKIKIDDDKNITNFKLKVNQNKKEDLIGAGALDLQLLKKLNKINIVMVHSAFAFKNAGKIEFIYEFYNDKNNIVGTLSPDFPFEIKETVIS